MTAQGANALMARAAGTRIALLRSEPLATAHTTGSSRSACTPLTCCAFNARSSPSTPAVFRVATLVRVATSSSTLAMSSSRARRLVAIELDGSDALARAIAIQQQSLVFQYIGALRWRKAKRIGVELRISFNIAERQLRGLTEPIGKEHRLRQTVAKADLDALEGRVLRARLRNNPFEAIARAGVAYLELFLEVVRAKQDRRGTRR